MSSYLLDITLANVISDISGTTGMAILRDIVRGERDPERLAMHKHSRIRASRQEIAQSLEGTWRQELLFVLEQSLDLYQTYQHKIAECSLRIEAHLQSMQARTTAEQPPPKGRPARGHRKQMKCLDLGSQLLRIAGVDLTQIDGI